MTEIIVTHCTRDTARWITQLRDKQHWSYTRIGQKFGLTRDRVARYYRLYKRYGPDVFIAA